MGSTRCARARIELTIDALDVFGGDKPRALVALVRPTAQLTSLQAEHESIARRAGMAPETRKFTPHVTLARLRGTPAEAAAFFIASIGALSGAALQRAALRAVLLARLASGGRALRDRGGVSARGLRARSEHD